MDSEKVKMGFHKYSNEVITFLSNFSRVTYASTLLVESNTLSAHQSNGYAEWDKRFYYDGKYKDSLLIKLGLELTRLKAGGTSTVIWDNVLNAEPNNAIDIERRNCNIYHGVSFIYGITDAISMAINVCTGKDTSKKEFENFLFPLRFTLLNFFKDL